MQAYRARLRAQGLRPVQIWVPDVDAPAFRITVEPDAGNGLRERSQIMVDKILAVPRTRIGSVIGRLDDETLLRLNRTLAFVLGLAE
jgi:mRNA interferase MazF